MCHEEILFFLAAQVWIRRERCRVPTSIAVSEEKETSAGAGWWGVPCGSSSTQVAGILFSFWSGLWLFGYLCVGNPDLWDPGLVIVLGSFLCGLFTPSQLSTGNRVVPESHSERDASVASLAIR